MEYERGLYIEHHIYIYKFILIHSMHFIPLTKKEVNLIKSLFKVHKEY